MKTKALITLTVLTIVLLFSCSQYKEEAPFFDGLFLEYNIGSGSTVLYEVSVINENEFKITEILKNYSSTEYIVDKYGKIKEAKRYSADGTIKDKKKRKGKFIYIWKPTHKLKVGDIISKGTMVDRTGKWKQWEVMVLRFGTAERYIEKYYEINTGFLVGQWGEVLIDTNANIPTVHE